MVIEEDLISKEINKARTILLKNSIEALNREVALKCFDKLIRFHISILLTKSKDIKTFKLIAHSIYSFIAVTKSKDLFFIEEYNTPNNSYEMRLVNTCLSYVEDSQNGCADSQEPGQKLYNAMIEFLPESIFCDKVSKLMAEVQENKKLLPDEDSDSEDQGFNFDSYEDDPEEFKTEIYCTMDKLQNNITTEIYNFNLNFLSLEKKLDKLLSRIKYVQEIAIENSLCYRFNDLVDEKILVTKIKSMAILLANLDHTNIEKLLELKQEVSDLDIKNNIGDECDERNKFMDNILSQLYGGILAKLYRLDTLKSIVPSLSKLNQNGAITKLNNIFSVLLKCAKRMVFNCTNGERTRTSVYIQILMEIKKTITKASQHLIYKKEKPTRNMSDFNTVLQNLNSNIEKWREVYDTFPFNQNNLDRLYFFLNHYYNLMYDRKNNVSNELSRSIDISHCNVNKIYSECAEEDYEKPEMGVTRFFVKKLEKNPVENGALSVTEKFDI